MRETIYGCTNVECGHIGVVLAEFVRTLTPSATPDPTIKLPFSSHIERGLLQIMLNNAGTAEHLPLYTTPKTGQLFTEPDISNNTS